VWIAIFGGTNGCQSRSSTLGWAAFPGSRIYHVLIVVLVSQLHSYVLPIMQGYCQISSFPIAREPVAFEEGEYALVDYIVISRRSRDRAGLRYQRRGVDDEAHVANFVETETIMRVKVRLPPLLPLRLTQKIILGSARGIQTCLHTSRSEARVSCIAYPCFLVLQY
jgi:hypothetical protein